MKKKKAVTVSGDLRNIGAGSATSVIKIAMDGSIHETVFGTIRYGKGHEPPGGHKPITIIELEQDK